MIVGDSEEYGKYLNDIHSRSEEWECLSHCYSNDKDQKLKGTNCDFSLFFDVCSKCKQANTCKTVIGYVKYRKNHED